MTAVEEVPDLAGDVALEAADRFELGLSFGLSALEVGAGGGVELGSAERDDVGRSVWLSVAAAVQAVADGFAGAGGNQGGAGVSGEPRL
ncbi:MAG TPA: hypothetical protein VMJ65_05505 [Solirubrobacteraceae bacterium]|nr:hypothetical protein [Solirubrobacteraceae bacterium]